MSHMPLRLMTVTYIVNSGVGKLGVDEVTAREPALWTSAEPITERD